MLILLALIPLASFICIFIFLQNRYPGDPGRRVILHSAIWSSCYLAFCLEVLSIFKWVTTFGLAITWLVPSMVFAAWIWNEKRLGKRVDLPELYFPASWWNRLLLLIIGIVLAATALVAWVTPPQTWDSLTYHLSRVAHWAQDRSIWHYATGIDRQTSMPPGAEEQMLSFYVLTQSDRLSNFPQWFAMLGSLVGVSLIAFYLGAKSSGQWQAAAFAATIPMGIVESSSTITDYVATFWVVCVVAECLAYYKSDENRALIYISLSGGLAILTKPITVPFILPFVLWLAFLLVKRHRFAIIKWGVIAVLLIGLINAGYLVRNYITYGALSNPVDFEVHYNQLHTVQGLIVNLLKNIGAQVGLPYLPRINAAWSTLIEKTAIKLGVDINDPRMTAVGVFHISAPDTAEDLTSNPYHAYVYFAVFIAMFFLIKKHGWPLAVYGLLVASTLVLFSFIYKWNLFGTRYDLAFFVIFTPVAGIVMEELDKVKAGHLLVVVLAVGSMPWLLSINSRPLIPKPERSYIQESILHESRENLYFASAPGINESYVQLTGKIKTSGCKDIGIMLKGDDPEYLLWVLMDAPRTSLNIQWIVSGPTTRYEQPGFQPCAVVCKDCGISENIRGTRYSETFGDLQLFLSP